MTGDEYYDSNEFRDMLAEYEQARNTGKPVFLDADELSEIADFYQLQGQTDDAETAISLALKLSPGAIAPLTYRIHEALYNGNIAKAKEYLSQIVEKDEPDYVYNQGEILIAEGHIDEADKFFRENFKTIPPDEYQDYVVDVATIFSEYGANEKAMEWMSRAKHEDTTDFKELMARTLFGLGKYKDSEKIFNELLDRDPFQKRYWNALASAQLMNEDYSNAIQSSEYAIAIDPTDPEGLLSKANGLYRLGNYEEALDYFRRYSELEPTDEFVLMHQGTTLINMGRNEEAISMLEHAADVAPADSECLPDIYQELAFSYSEKGDTDKAIEYLNKTDSLDCDHTGIRVIKGHILLAGHRMKEAQDQFYHAILESDNASKTLMRIIVSLYDNRYLEAAYQTFHKFFDIVPPEYNEGHAYMALCCYDMRRYDEFLDYLKTACERNPKECKQALSHIFPDDLEPEKYYEYVKNKMKP